MEYNAPLIRIKLNKRFLEADLIKRQRMLETLENLSPEVKREVIRLLVDHIIVEDDTIVIHHIVPVTDNGRLSLKHNSLCHQKAPYQDV